MTITAFETCLLLSTAALLWVFRAFTKSRSPPPPGPPGVPILGNISDIPAEDSHLAPFALNPPDLPPGPLIQLKVLDKTVVVINDVRTAVDLLDKRGALYSDRPKLYMAPRAGWDFHLAFMSPEEPWRLRRQLVHQKFSLKATATMHGMLRRTTLELARHILHTPERFREHIRRRVSSVYGIRVADENDPYVEIAEKAMGVAGLVLLPGGNQMDAFPFLRFVPEWVPILGYWTRLARETRKYPTDLLEVPFERTKEDMRNGVARPCMATEFLEKSMRDNSPPEQEIKEACAVSYIGGADTTVGSLLSFVMAMVLWPEFQHKAQAELDAVLGNRLPELSDEVSLPYVEAIVRETYRFYPVAPLGLPHALKEDDVYQGYHMSQGTTVLSNVWAILRDESVFPDGGKFNPGRWLRGGTLNQTMQDPRIAVFGFGRRICPGRHFADASVFLAVATLLKCFSFEVFTDDGAEHPPSGKIVTGLVSCPAPFKCTIRPRSETTSALINAALEAFAD
ncbi:cytochrome P450 [Auricularia subglabra TFB-10046 SS5]|nr:cytochrome P450 [Auricularia subglabra TFB-10046 SS5]